MSMPVCKFPLARHSFFQGNVCHLFYTTSENFFKTLVGDFDAILRDSLNMFFLFFILLYALKYKLLILLIQIQRTCKFANPLTLTHSLFTEWWIFRLRSNEIWHVMTAVISWRKGGSVGAALFLLAWLQSCTNKYPLTEKKEKHKRLIPVHSKAFPNWISFSWMNISAVFVQQQTHGAVPRATWE